MSKSIDEKVVQMEFDNQRFNDNVKSSISWLDKLKGSLDFSGASASIGDMGKAAGKVDFGPLGNAVETVSVKFSALQVAAITALQNITNKAIDAGERLLRALSIDQISAGWQKYEDNIAEAHVEIEKNGGALC